jgi:uncharacterized phage-associated protein
MRSARTVVHYFLGAAERLGSILVTPLKLQKLLYYVQAWHLVFKGTPLFYEDIEAWVHGPVVPDVYHRYKEYKFSALPAGGLNFQWTVEEQQILQFVWAYYGDKDAKFLEELTHSEYPWIHARQGLHGGERSTRKISLQDMRQYYSDFVISYYPPRIKQEALQMKNTENKHRLMKNIFSGIGSVLDISPTSRRLLNVYSSEDFNDFDSDFEALTSDWEKVGDCIQTVIDILKDEKDSLN